MYSHNVKFIFHFKKNKTILVKNHQSTAYSNNEILALKFHFVKFQLEKIFLLSYIIISTTTVRFIY